MLSALEDWKGCLQWMNFFSLMYLNNTWYLNRRFIGILAESIFVACVMQEVRKSGRMMLLILIQKARLFRRLLNSSLLFCRISQIIIASHCFHTSFKKTDSSTDCALKGVFVCVLYIWQLPWLVSVSTTQFII